MGERWRVGRKLKRTLYRDEECVGMVDSPEIAAEIVEALNGRERYIEPGDDLSVLPGGEWAGPGDPPCGLYAGHCPRCACVLSSGHPGSCDIHCGQPQRPESGRERSPEARRSVICGACLNPQPVDDTGRVEIHIDNGGSFCNGSQRLAP